MNLSNYTEEIVYGFEYANSPGTFLPVGIPLTSPSQVFIGFQFISFKTLNKYGLVMQCFNNVFIQLVCIVELTNKTKYL